MEQLFERDKSNECENQKRGNILSLLELSGAPSAKRAERSSDDQSQPFIEFNKDIFKEQGRDDVEPMKNQGVEHVLRADAHNVNEVLKGAKAGDTVVLADGKYSDLKIQMSGHSSLDRPITLKPETPGGVTLSDASSVSMEGEGLKLQGFKFDGATNGISMDGANGCLVTDNSFKNGNGVDISLKNGASGNSIRENDFTNSTGKGIVIQQHFDSDAPSLNNSISANSFDSYSNKAAIQVGLNGRDRKIDSGTVIEDNSFKDISAPHSANAGILLNSGGVTVRDNTFQNFNAHVSLRHGQNDVIDGNSFKHSWGITVQDGPHQITGNTFEDSSRTSQHAISLRSGEWDGQSAAPAIQEDGKTKRLTHIAAHDVLVAGNKIEGYRENPIGDQSFNNGNDRFKPRDNVLLGNTINDQTGPSDRPSQSQSHHQGDGQAPHREPSHGDSGDNSNSPDSPSSSDNWHSSNPTLESARSQLQAAESHIPNDNNSLGRNRREFFQSNMHAFEQRARANGVSEEEVAKTYEQVDRLLTEPGTAHSRPMNERVRIAEQLMMHAADPSGIDQGHLCCNVTTVEDRTFRMKPSAAAEMIATTAMTGQWVAPDGKVIKIDPRSLEPGSSERRDIPQDNHRSEASQMFQVAALNDVGQRYAHPLYFQQRASGSEQETGGYWSDASGNFAKRFNGVNSQAITGVGQRLLGDHDPFVLMNSQVPRDHSGLITFDSANELGRELQQFDHRDEPAVLVVNAWDPIFSKHNSKIGVPVNHVVSITDFDAANDRVYIDDQHGKRRDQWVDLDDLYRATT